MRRRPNWSSRTTCRPSEPLPRINPWGSNLLYRHTLSDSRARLHGSYTIRCVMLGQEVLLGRPTLTRTARRAAKGGRPAVHLGLDEYGCSTYGCDFFDVEPADLTD